MIGLEVINEGNEMRKLTFTYENIDKYYQKKFMFDMCNYFVIEGWDFIPRGTFPQMTEQNVIRKLYKRGQLAVDGSPAVYMGAGPWRSTEQSFEFCGMFVYMWLVDKCLRKLYGKDDALLFCKTFSWPIIESVQPDEDFDLVATLKEAGLAPAEAESDNYLTMLDAVLPYMQEKTKEFLLPYGDALKEEYETHIHSLREWIRSTEDEIVSYYGLRLRKEKDSSDQWPQYRYYSLESLAKFSDTYKICSFNDIAKLNLSQAPFTFAEITQLEGPVIPHYSDLEVLPIKYEEKSLLHVVPLYDKKFEQHGKKGIKDSWGRIIVPAIFEECESCTYMDELHTDNSHVAVKKNGKWGLIKRNDYKHVVFPFIYNWILSYFDGDYLVQIGNKYGLIASDGSERLPIEMDDIYSRGFNDVIPFKKNSKFGFLFKDGSRTEAVFDTFDERDGLEYELVCLNGKWGYLDKDLNFTTKRSQAAFGSGLGICHGHNRQDKSSENDEDEMSSFCDWNSGIDKGVSFWMEEIDGIKGKVQFEIGIDQPVLYFSMVYSEDVFAIDMRQPYLLKLLNNEERFIKTWDGYEEEKEFIKQWLNQKNEKTRVMNWAEAVHTYNSWLIADEPSIDYCYSKGKAITFAEIKDQDIEDIDFPKLEY